MLIDLDTFLALTHLALCTAPWSKKEEKEGREEGMAGRKEEKKMNKNATAKTCYKID